MSEQRPLDSYADGEIVEYADTNVPTFLKYVYLILPIWGIFWAYTFWDGSSGALDRGHWHDLQKVANTTFEKQGPQIRE